MIKKVNRPLKILYFLNCLFPWESGCWLYRSRIPSAELQKRGHEVQFILPVKTLNKKWLDYPDVVVYGVYGGTYSFDPIPSINEFKKRGVKIVYDLDDDLFTVNPDNPCKAAVKTRLSQAKELLRIADTVTTTTDVLKKKFRKYNKNVMICPNSLDFSKFPKRKGSGREFRIGYSGAASHWGDLSLVIDVLTELQKKYDFRFILQGMSGRPIIADIYNYRMILRQGLQPEKKQFYEVALKVFDKIRKLKYVHIPFYPPEMYPSILAPLDLDIGICPLKSNVFNEAKSCQKFYEYATTGTVTISSDVLPYNKEVGYYAKNTFKDWYRKLEKLIVNKKFRDNLLKKQQEFVFKKRDIKEVAKLWEKALTF